MDFLGDDFLESSYEKIKLLRSDVDSDADFKKKFVSLLSYAKKADIDWFWFSTGKCYALEEFRDDLINVFSKDNLFVSDVKILCLYLISIINEANFFKKTTVPWVNTDYYGFDDLLSYDDISRVERVRHSIINFSFYKFARENVYERIGDLSNAYKAFELKLTEVNDSIAQFNAVKKEIDKYTGEAALVVFSQGFSNDLKEKMKEHKVNRFFVIGFGILSILIPFFSAYLSYSSRVNVFDYYHGFYDSLSGFFSGGFSFLFSLFAAEVLILYFFRICLINHNNLKSQILQLRLRVSVANFLSDYLNHDKLAGKNQDTLARFESLVFRDIYPGGVPSASILDGVDRLSELIKSFKR